MSRGPFVGGCATAAAIGAVVVALGPEAGLELALLVTMLAAASLATLFELRTRG